MSTPSHLDVIVIGGGQAGLSASRLLQKEGLTHMVFERDRIGEAWRSKRWDTFCLVTPNWQCTLPDFHYDKEFGGRDPDGFMVRDEIVSYLEAYRAAYDQPVRERVSVTSVKRNDSDFAVTSTDGSYTCDAVVVAAGGYHTPKIPKHASRLPESIQQIHSSEYRNAAQCAEGEILIIGTGQSGCQIAEDLHLDGRKVHLAVGTATRAPRYYRGRDVTAWLVDMGYYDVTVEDHPQGVWVRTKANQYMTGRDGGREIDLRQFASEGMQLYGRLNRFDDSTALFSGDLAMNLDTADASAQRIKHEIDRYIEKNEVAAQEAEPPYRPVWRPKSPALSLDMEAAGISTVIWATGFKSDFSYIEEDVFDHRGYPKHHRGITPVSGLYFLGLPWMHTWGSGRFSAVGDDAAHLVADISRLSEERSKLRVA